MINALKEANVLVRVSGYPKLVAPVRENIINVLKAGNIEISDLTGMSWKDICSYENRKRSLEELKRVFSTCGMKECVIISRYGKIYYCSRQMAANETDIYPNSLHGEYIDVRHDNIEQLRKSIDNFLKLEYISTCDYCDGIVVLP